MNRHRIGGLQANIEAKDLALKSLEADLASSRNYETTEKTQRLAVAKEKTLSDQKLIITERKLEDLIAQAESYRKRYERVISHCVLVRTNRTFRLEQTNVRCQVRPNGMYVLFLRFTTCLFFPVTARTLRGANNNSTFDKGDYG